MSTIRAAWESFAEAVIPEDAPAVQRQEMRRAFYAGAGSILGGCVEIGGDSVSEDEGVAMMESWKKEIERFYILMKLGKA